MKRFHFAVAAAGLLTLAMPAFSLTVAPATPEERVQNAAAICHATVLGSECFRSETDGGIYTRTWLRVNEALKGKFPATITVVHRGGRVGGEGEVSSDAPALRAGDERLLLLDQRADGTLFVDSGSSGAPSLARASASVNPSADADGDGVSNINEFRLGTSPVDAGSVLRFTSGSASGINWLATPYELYEVESTTDFTNWFRAGNPVVPTTTNGSFTSFPASPANRLFFRVLRAP